MSKRDRSALGLSYRLVLSSEFRVLLKIKVILYKEEFSWKINKQVSANDEVKIFENQD